MQAQGFLATRPPVYTYGYVCSFAIAFVHVRLISQTATSCFVESVTPAESAKSRLQLKEWNCCCSSLPPRMPRMCCMTPWTSTPLQVLGQETYTSRQLSCNTSRTMWVQGWFTNHDGDRGFPAHSHCSRKGGRHDPHGGSSHCCSSQVRRACSSVSGINVCHAVAIQPSGLGCSAPALVTKSGRELSGSVFHA